MDEQFTPEYVKFILSNEAQCLQKHIDIQLGTVVYSEHIDRMAAVSEVLEDPDNTNADFYATFEKYSQQSGLRRDEVIVLPSLRDLLRIIEGTEWRWKVQRSKRRDLVRYVVSASRGDFADFEFIEEIESDTMLAAAKVAARAVEAQHETTTG